METLRLAIQTRLGERMVSMNSTLVETVSINYEDFNESFLTCGTCLCMYDGNEHTPKLLQCSHTVCLHCLTRIAASQQRDTGTFRCPICRELITIPRGGVSALPPSFLVNQLLDLMSRQRREVIPKCSVHINQELLFCETCDLVFCTLCIDGSHNDTNNQSNNCNEHTIIPFSIAIKRMSEILLYKANECISKLSQAQDGVSNELNKLEENKNKCIETINETFQQLQELLNTRKDELINILNNTCIEKRKILNEQYELIENEKNKVEQECQGLQYQVEVRNITQRIESLTEKLDTANTLGEPRENSFIKFDIKQNNSYDIINEQLNILGRIFTSTTFPSLCTAKINENIVIGLENFINLQTVDYHGNQRKNGGDPIKAEILSTTIEQQQQQQQDINLIDIIDCDDGTYKIKFRPLKSGRYGIKITIFERNIKDFPIYFDVNEHNNPLLVYGTRGHGKDEFLQPVAIAIDNLNEIIYILDTGNSRIKVLNFNFQFIKHITNDGLLGRSCTGMDMTNDGLIVVNWRTKILTEFTTDGITLKSFTYNAFQEPIDVAVDNNYGHILVADNGLNCVFVFDADGKILFQVGKKGTFNLISSVTVGPSSEIIVADTRIQIFSAKGDFIKLLTADNNKGRYGGMAVDLNNRILASRTEQKGKTSLQLLSLDDEQLNSTIDSYDNKLKRPSGIGIILNSLVVVVDLGNNCIKKFRYW